jgi:hypothetical protein
MLEGNCDIFTWILVGLTILYTIYYVGSFIYNLIKLKNKKQKYVTGETT